VLDPARGDYRDDTMFTGTIRTPLPFPVDIDLTVI
jgi:hypothetical protein